MVVGVGGGTQCHLLWKNPGLTPSMESHSMFTDLINTMGLRGGFHAPVCAPLAPPFSWWDDERVPNPVMLDNAGGSRAFPAASSDSVTSVTCAQCEPAPVCEENTAPQANLAFSGKCQSGCVVQGMKHVHECPAGGPFEGLKRSSSCSSSCSSCTVDQRAVLQASLLLLAYWPVFWCLFPTTNPLATANIDALWWRCCATCATSVGCRCCPLLPSSEGSVKEGNGLFSPPAKPFFTGVKWKCDFPRCLHCNDCDFHFI